MLPGQSLGQARDRCWLEGRGGVSVPAGELREFADPGFNVGLGGGCPVAPRLGLTGTVGHDAFGSPGPFAGGEVRNLSVLGGVSLPLTNRWSAPVSPSVVARAGLGATFIRRSVGAVLVQSPSSRAELLEGVSFTTETGLRVGFPLSSRFLAFVDGAWRLVFVDEADVDTPLGRIEGFGKLSSFPVTAGLEFRL